MADKRIRKLYRGDCLDILEDYIEPHSIDLIYLDPPFNSKSIYNLPFKNKDRSYKSVEAFVDTWTWTTDDDMRLAEMGRSFDPTLSILADIVKLVRKIEDVRRSSSASYLLNMGLRLRAMHAVLKDTGSIYLHCDPAESHPLKLVMDVIFGKKNFRNEIVWAYPASPSAVRRDFPRKHDTLLRYSKTQKWTFNADSVRIPYAESSMERIKYPANASTVMAGSEIKLQNKGKIPPTVWSDIQQVYRYRNERLGYPTQKPLALLERIIKASSNPNDVVLDTFCGCGTTVHAAEKLGRQWIGIDISRFSTELMRERILDNFSHQVQNADIKTFGLPDSVDEARSLARENPFEFEKWVCGRIGANGMGIRKKPGDRGADGGIDGVIELSLIRNMKVDKSYAIVQVKGGKVTPDSVKALSETVRRLDAAAGIIVCFEDQMGTVENQRDREVWSDDAGTYPRIQGYSVKDLLQDKRLKLPSRYGRKRSGRITALI